MQLFAPSGPFSWVFLTLFFNEPRVVYGSLFKHPIFDFSFFLIIDGIPGSLDGFGDMYLLRSYQ